MNFTVKQKGDYSKITKYLNNLKRKTRLNILEKYGKRCVNALANATPKESGKTANSWSYEIISEANTHKLILSNSHRNDGVSIAIILQYGHGTGTGGYVQGRDYINPAIQPLFDQIVQELWKELTSL